MMHERRAEPKRVSARCAPATEIERFLAARPAAAARHPRVHSDEFRRCVES
jgi:hypothetical protein